MKEEAQRRKLSINIGLRKLGDLDGAFDVIELATNRYNNGPMLDLWSRESRVMRAHPRFRPFVEKIGLVDYWRSAGWPDACRAAGDSFTCD